jgi:cathepsin B
MSCGFVCSTLGLVVAAEGLTVEDLKARVISKDALLRGREELPVKTHELAGVSVPDSFDSATNWPQCPSIGDIWDQGACGDCWAVSTVTVATDRMCIESGGVTSGASQPRLSVEHMVGCCRACGFGCGDGFPNYAWMWLAGQHVPGGTSDYGLVTGGQQGDTEWCSSYTVPKCNHYDTPGVPLPSCEGGIPAQTPTCPTTCDANSTYKTAFAQDIHRFQSAYSVPSDPEQIKAEIFAHGPVTAGFTVYADWLHYTTGVYTTKGGEEIGAHAVAIVGWGVEDGVEYWHVRNSFGPKWGDNGFFKIKRGVDECEIESSVIAGLYKVADQAVAV